MCSDCWRHLFSSPLFLFSNDNNVHQRHLWNYRTILQPYNKGIANKPITTLRRLLTNVKDKDKPEDRQGAVYKSDQMLRLPGYLHSPGETARNLSTRLTDDGDGDWSGTTNFDSKDDYRTGCRNVSQCQQQQSYLGLRSPGRSNIWIDSWVQTLHILLFNINIAHLYCRKS